MPVDLLIPLYPEVLKFGPNATNIQNLVAELKAALVTKDLKNWERQAAKKFNLKKLNYIEHFYRIALPYSLYNGFEDANKEVKDDCELVLKQVITMTLLIVFTQPFKFEIMKRDTMFMPKPENYLAFFGLNLDDYAYKGEKIDTRESFPTLNLVH